MITMDPIEILTLAVILSTVGGIFAFWLTVAILAMLDAWKRAKELEERVHEWTKDLLIR